MATKNKTKQPTPLMKQYMSIKAKHPDAILLFRVGDFYETFGEDAIKTANILGIVLTARNNGSSKLELAGFPYHSLDTYLPKLVRAGMRVAICEQLEEPSKAKKIVRRGVTEMVTPGVSYNDQVLNHKSNNYLAVVHNKKNAFGIAFLDVSTGDFLLSEGNKQYIDKLLQSFTPSEVLFQRNFQKKFHELFGNTYHTYQLEDWCFSEDFAKETLLNQFGTNSLKGFGVEELELGKIAAGAALHYVSETQNKELKHVKKVARINETNFVWLDKFTVRNLELYNSYNESATTLLDVLDNTITPMGGRLFKKWIALPLKQKAQIENRLETVSFFIKNESLAEFISKNLSLVGDIERLISKASVGKISPREVNQLKNGLQAIIPIKNACLETKNTALKNIAEQISGFDLLIEKIEKTLKEDAPVNINKGSVIKEGISEELDELRNIAFSGKDFLVQIQLREIEKTGIPSLKIGFNNVFGYYLEVTNVHKSKVPSEWVRKQTLTNAERYITEELKEYEAKILGAEEKIQVLEVSLFNDLVLSLADYIQSIQLAALQIAKIDSLLSFASVSKKNNYQKPEINNSNTIDIIAGRHPVIEQNLPLGESYVANDVYLDDKKQQIIIITGPNMAGKSALLRQTAIIVLMAQMGCFVPANQAKIGIVDKVFTRVGASDNLSVGESTFMVEMNETASILNNLSDKSLVLLDEIGRGTSTYDGISIAWAITEYLHENKAKPRTLFATHYHELNEMTNSFERIKNYNVAIKEINNKIIFLRKLIPGGSEHSFGIHVAEMAGIPKVVIKRANQVLKQLEEKLSDAPKSAKKVSTPDADYQLSFFQLDDPVLSQIKEEIENIDIDTLTPVEALMKLNEIKKLTGA